MSIKMQGSWLVRVKSRNAVFAQEFQIQGAVIGNGTYAGNISTPEIFCYRQQLVDHYSE